MKISSIKKFFLNDLFLVLLIFIFLTVWYTYPLIFVIGDSVHDEGDSVANLWLLSRNIDKILNEKEEFFYSDDVFYPEGFYLSSGEMYIEEMLIGLPIYLLTSNPILTYNLVLLISYILCGLGMYLLVKFYIKNKYGALISAIIFTFCSYKFNHLFQLQLLNIQFLPFTIFFFHKIFQEKKLKYAILSSVFFSLQVLSSGYYAVFTSLLILFYLLFLLQEKRDKQTMFCIFVFFLLSLGLVAPFYIQYYFHYKTHPIEGIASSDVLDYFFPGDVNYFYSLFGIKPQGSGERNVFIGFIALFLSFLSLFFLNKKLIKFYIITGLVFFIFSLGPQPLFLNQKINSLRTINTFIYSLPPFSSLRIPIRFSIMVMFSISILAGYGTSKLFSFLNNKKISLLVFIVLLFFIITEYWGIFTYFPLEDLEVYDWLSKEKGNFAVLELPNEHTYNALYLYYSLKHKKKLYFGITTFYPKRKFEIHVTQREIPKLLSKVRSNSYIIPYKNFTHKFKDEGVVLDSYVYKLNSNNSILPLEEFKYLIIHEGGYPYKKGVCTNPAQYILKIIEVLLHYQEHIYMKK